MQMRGVGEPANDTLPHASSHFSRILDAYGLMVFMLLKACLPMLGGTKLTFRTHLSTRLSKPNLQGDGGPQELTLAHKLDV